MPKVVHFEVPVDDPERATAFYRDVLGWQITGFGDQHYWLVQAGADEEMGANGALTDRDALHRTPVLVVGVGDLDAALERVASSGGRVLQDKLPVPGFGWNAYVEDTEGNTISLFQPSSASGG